MHKVVRPFPYAGNGYTLELLNVGAERDFGPATAGLLAEGWIEVAAAVIANSDGNQPSVDASAAIEVITAEEPAVEEIAAHPLDHDGDGKLGGSPPKSRRRK